MDEMNTNPCLHAAIAFFFFLTLRFHCNNGQNVSIYTHLYSARGTAIL